MTSKSPLKMIQQGRTLTIQYKGIILAYSTNPYRTTYCYGFSDQLAAELRKKDIPLDLCKEWYYSLDTTYAKELVNNHIKEKENGRKDKRKEKEREVKEAK